ncbi:hypothetical protein N5P37_005701 [Trichoderma harzianum]|uniref:Uncharacterized protein n=1 Tax=Trichoderma harzianum CBS 226.95 TaxID=983964 RepID=A0A2T3ZRC6_TRIHA|nr:hypothetical protein M431DRAFT_157431 [Trichoderma harzianum CBS 226.95]KAK0761649.1 hypothetical protein N5P37_005701 [Trichoderma harzianum]PTB47354.1 hypothetical protein M431DRAFT_157431 [Trichoderma harzianum CBS 226.95]
MRSLAFITALSLSIYGCMAESGGYPGNPCERVGAKCDPVVQNFCQGKFDATVELPCGPHGFVGVGCCWHGPPPPK